MMNSTLLEIYAQLRAAETERQIARPLPPATQQRLPTFRQRVAQGLVDLGLRLDAEASRAVFGPREAAPQPNRSDV